MTESVGLVQQFVQRTGQLYSLPAAAAEVLRLTSESRVDSRAIKDCLERDPALATRILRAVNSSFFGVSRQVTDLGQALAVLGIRPLKLLVLGFSLPKELFAGLEANTLARYWRRTLIKAVAARELAERQWRIPGDEPFLAGLVQDIGLLALVQHLGEPYLRLLELAETRGGSLLDHELETLGFDHAVLSARLLAHWGLPAPLCAAISVPPNAARVAELSPSERKLPQILHLAELLVRLIEQPYGAALSELSTFGAQYCDLTAADLESVVKTLEQKVAGLASALALELPAGRSYVDLLVAAQQQLADESLAAAAGLAGPPVENELRSLSGQLQTEMAAALGRSFSQPAAARQPGSSPERNLAATESARGRLDSKPADRSHWKPAESRAGISDDPGIHARLASAVQRCRQSRRPVSLALFEIDRFSDLLVTVGPPALADLVQWLRSALGDWTGQRGGATLESDSCLAMIWEDCPRNDAVQMARQVLATAKPLSLSKFGLSSELTLSCGLATIEFPPKNFPPQELLAAAQRCLGGAQLSGGDTVKSIAI
jgi:HD-like signal output (HDOD) protein/GGDEF domain-containing protein